MIGTGFSFDDGEQLLVSVQKPLGMVLEQDNDDDNERVGAITVVELQSNGSAERAGVKIGDCAKCISQTSGSGQCVVMDSKWSQSY
eukprot:scaffold4968_cov127-Cylindrotheca_fusiformis.AAC.10